MLDILPIDLLLVVINDLEYIDKCELSMVNKYLLNIFDDNKNNIICNDIIDITDDSTFYYNHRGSAEVIDHLRDTEDILDKCINKFPKCKIYLSNEYDILLQNVKYKYNLYSIKFSYFSLNIADIIKLYPNVKILDFLECCDFLNNCDTKLISNIKKITICDCFGIDDISMLSHVETIEIYRCSIVNIFPKQFYSQSLTFIDCDFINDNMISCFKGVNTLYIYGCDNLVNKNLLNELSIKNLYIDIN